MITCSSVPICYFPTLTVFIDDQHEFLESIKYRFQKSNLICFSNQKDALNYIKNNINKRLWYLDKVKKIEEESHNHKRIEYNLSHLYKKIYDSERFKIITSIIVDYDMPEMNGIKFAEYLKQFEIDIYLLTGAADEKIAVDAFNKKLIKGYIRKLQEDTNNVILESISNSQIDYFNKITTTLLNLNILNKNSVLLKDEFKIFFNTMLHKNNIIECYIDDLDLSFILIDDKNNLNLLFIYSEPYLNSIYKLAKDEELPNQILKELKCKNKMICFHNIEDTIFSFTHDYKKFLYDTTKLVINDNIYYYKFIKNINFDNKYLSYKTFKETK